MALGGQMSAISKTHQLPIVFVVLLLIMIFLFKAIGLFKKNLRFVTVVFWICFVCLVRFIEINFFLLPYFLFKFLISYTKTFSSCYTTSDNDIRYSGFEFKVFSIMEVDVHFPSGIILALLASVRTPPPFRQSIDLSISGIVVTSIPPFKHFFPKGCRSWHWVQAHRHPQSLSHSFWQICEINGKEGFMWWKYGGHPAQFTCCLNSCFLPTCIFLFLCLSNYTWCVF